jgi:hypothetical protein
MGLDSLFWIPGFGFLVLDSWVWIPKQRIQTHESKIKVSKSTT